MSIRSGFGGGLVVYGALAAGALWWMWPVVGNDVKAALASLSHDIGHPAPLFTRVFNMRLDPSLASNVEDRRGGDGGGVGGDYPDGPEMSGAAGGHPGLGCWDTVEQHPVPVEFCQREHGRGR